MNDSIFVNILKVDFKGQHKSIIYTDDNFDSVVHYLDADDASNEELNELFKNEEFLETTFVPGDFGQPFIIYVDDNLGHVLTQCQITPDNSSVMVFDKAFVTTETKPLPHEVKALQIMGIPDEEIAELFSKVISEDTDIDEEAWRSQFEEARHLLTEFWNNDGKIKFEGIVWYFHGLYFVEVSSAAMADVFKKHHAKALNPKYVKYLLEDDVVPAQDGRRYMRLGCICPSKAVWKTLFLLPSLEVYDAVCNELIPSVILDNIVTREDAVKVISSLFDCVNAFTINELPIQWIKAARKAYKILESLNGGWTNEEVRMMTLASLYILCLPELFVKNIPAYYISKYKLNNDGYLYDKRRLRCLGIDEYYFEKDKPKRISDGVESVDFEIIKHIGMDYMSQLPSSVRRIENHFILRHGEMGNDSDS